MAKIKFFCHRCPLHLNRKTIVFGRGQIPADILFIGEAPGRSEDLLGQPFIGPSGKILDALMAEVNNVLGNLTTYYITNTVLCRPSDCQDQNRQPFPGEILQCKQNVLSIIMLVKPKRICFIGKVAEEYYRRDFPNAITIPHPAYILRTGGKFSPVFRQAFLVLKTMFQEVLNGRED